MNFFTLSPTLSFTVGSLGTPLSSLGPVVPHYLSRLFISHSIDLVFQSHPSHFESGVAKHLLMPHHSYLGLASERIYVTAKPIFGTSSVQQIIQTMVCTPLPARQTCIYITRNKQQIMRLER